MTPEQTEELKKILSPKKISTSKEDVDQHSGGVFYIKDFPPDVVCYAESVDDVIKITDFCIKHHIPLIPYGSGTSVEGHIAAPYGGICLDMSRMNRIIEFNPHDRCVIVQPGISYNELNEFLDKQGFHFPVEAGWGASIGGMMATNASGAGATDVGSMAKNVMSCNVVVCKNGSATKITTGTKSEKSSAGYNLTHLFVGSEGTLGVITEVSLRIRKNFTHYNTVCCQFNTLDQATQFVIDMKNVVQFRRVELMDQLQTKACVRYSEINFLDLNKFTMLIELAGSPESVQEECTLVLEALKKNCAINIRDFKNKESSKFLWTMRKNACAAAIALSDEDKKVMATDASVPLSKLSTCIRACCEYKEKFGLLAPLVAHVGDGNFHFTILVDPANKSELEAAKQFNEAVVREALKHGGTCTGEHGIGFGKKKFLQAEHGDSIFLMQLIKKALDPYNIFNPGKIINCERSYFSKENKKTDQKMANTLLYGPVTPCSEL